MKIVIITEYRKLNWFSVMGILSKRTISIKLLHYEIALNNSERFMLEFLQTTFLDFYIFKSLVSFSVS